MPGGQGYLMYSNASSSISAVGNIFPVVLYLVAAMVTFTTMTRFVDEERTNAGIFKALAIAKIGYHSQICPSMDSLQDDRDPTRNPAGHYFLSGIISNIITQGMVIERAESIFMGI